MVVLGRRGNTRNRILKNILQFVQEDTINFFKKVLYKIRSNLTPVRMATIKTKQKINIGQDVVKLELSCTVGGRVKWYSCSGKHYGSATKHLE